MIAKVAVGPGGPGVPAVAMVPGVPVAVLCGRVVCDSVGLDVAVWAQADADSTPIARSSVTPQADRRFFMIHPFFFSPSSEEA